MFVGGFLGGVHAQQCSGLTLNSGITPGVLRGPDGVPGIESGLVAHKERERNLQHALSMRPTKAKATARGMSILFLKCYYYEAPKSRSEAFQTTKGWKQVSELEHML